MTNLQGRRALVTGASRGIGAEIVRRLAADGASVAFTYGRSSAEAEKLVAEVTAAGGKAVAIQADSADAEQVAKSVDDAVAQLGGLDVLVNNAGVAVLRDHRVVHASRSSTGSSRSTCARSSSRFSARFHTWASDGRIINIGSINADRVPAPGLAAYAMTKAAVAGLTRGLARELGPRGITVNNVQPGPIATDMNPDEGEFAASAKELMAIGRYGHPSDVAGVVGYLAGRDTGYITGANWNVDGGFTV